MVFYLAEDGTMSVYDSENINQGSVNANKIEILTRLSSTGVMSLSFRLPNGQPTPPVLATLVASGIEGFNLWTYTMEAPLTDYPGSLTVQVTYAVNGTEKLNSTAATFTVNRGTGAIIPQTTAADWNTILAVYQQCRLYAENANASAAASAGRAEASYQSSLAAEASANDALEAKGEAELAKNAAEAAQAQAYNYATSAEGAKSAAESAQAAAEDAAEESGESAEDSEAWAVGKRGGVDVPSSDPAYHNNSKYYSEQAATTNAVKYVEQSLTDEQKAQARENINAPSTNGSFPDMSVGNAEQLIADVGTEDRIPYNFRPVAGQKSVLKRVTEEVVGGTIEWNQMLNPAGWSGSDAGLTFDYDEEERVVHISGTATRTSFSRPFFKPIEGHVYIVSSGNIDYQFLYLNDLHLTGTEKESYVWKCSLAPNAGYGWGCIGLTVGQEYEFDLVPVVHDLTKMFGSVIADYVLSIEQATTGSGVSWFKNLFPKSYYEHNPGEQMSVCTNAHITRGFNAWDGNKAIVIGGNEYYVYGTYGTLSLDGEEITVTANKFTPAHNGIITASSPSATLCINLSWSGQHDGEYAPYVEHSYPLSPVELRGIPMLDSSNRLYYDGDVYHPDGTVTRRYGSVNLGDLTWNYNSEANLFLAQLPNGSVSVGTSLHVRCPKYETSTAYTTTDKVVFLANGEYIAIRDDAYTDSSAFKTAMNGVYAVYILPEAQTETAIPYAGIQQVEDFGTEEYVDALYTAAENPRDVAIPVGHNSLYQTNLRDKLQNLPDNADYDGTYLVKQEGAKQTLYPFVPSGGGVGASLTIKMDNLSKQDVILSPDTNGVVTQKCSTGISYTESGGFTIEEADESDIANRTTLPNRALCLRQVNAAITAYLTDGTTPALTDAQKSAAKSFLGITDQPAVPVKGVQVAGSDLAPDTDGKVNIPLMDTGTYGVAAINTNKGITTSPYLGYTVLSLNPIVQYYIDSSAYRPANNVTSAYKFAVTQDTIDIAVRAAMCDGKGTAWTDAQRLAALLRMGCTVDENGFVKWNAQS